MSAIFLLASACRTELLPVDQPHAFPGVRMQDVTFSSTALGRSMPYRVYWPDSIKAGSKLPVVYLLHGAFSSFRDWSNRSMVAAWAARGLILVMPEGGMSSYYMNADGKPQERYEDYLTQELPRDVAARFPAAEGRVNRALVGISMGGFAAVSIALRHPDLYCFVAAISPAIDILHRGFHLQRFGEWLRIRHVFGPAGGRMRTEVDPWKLVQTAEPAKTPYLYLTAGKAEPLHAPIDRFARQLSARHFAFELHTQPGGHDWGEWNLQLPGVFENLRSHLGQETLPAGKIQSNGAI